MLVLAKAPIPGRVKTRLCPPCTPEQAAEIASAALSDTLAAAVACGAPRTILALDGEPGGWIPEGVEVVAQIGGPFDQRLAAAWSHAGGPGLQIGMDTPQVTPELLDECLGVLVDGDDPPAAVLGPATDGGWWAIGFREHQPGAFVGVPMSDPRTGEVQAERLRSLGLRLAELPVLRDMDTVEDAIAMVALAPASATAGVVRQILGERIVNEPEPP